MAKDLPSFKEPSEVIINQRAAESTAFPSFKQIFCYQYFNSALIFMDLIICEFQFPVVPKSINCCLSMAQYSKDVGRTAIAVDARQPVTLWKLVTSPRNPCTVAWSSLLSFQSIFFIGTFKVISTELISIPEDCRLWHGRRTDFFTFTENLGFKENIS